MRKEYNQAIYFYRLTEGDGIYTYSGSDRGIFPDIHRFGFVDELIDSPILNDFLAFSYSNGVLMVANHSQELLKYRTRGGDTEVVRVVLIDGVSSGSYIVDAIDSASLPRYVVPIKPSGDGHVLDNPRYYPLNTLLEEEIFRTKFNDNFVIQNKKEFAQILNAFIYARQNEKRLQILYNPHSFLDVEKAKKYLISLLRLFPCDIANNISWTTTKDAFVSYDIELVFDREDFDKEAINIEIGGGIADTIYLDKPLCRFAQYIESLSDVDLDEFINRLLRFASNYSFASIDEYLSLVDILLMHFVIDDDGDVGKLLLKELTLIENRCDFITKYFDTDVKYVLGNLYNMINNIKKYPKSILEGTISRILKINLTLHDESLEESVYEMVMGKDMTLPNHALLDEILDDKNKPYGYEYFVRYFAPHIFKDTLKAVDGIESYVAKSRKSAIFADVLSEKIHKVIDSSSSGDDYDNALALLRVFDSIDEHYLKNFIETSLSVDDSKLFFLRFKFIIECLNSKSSSEKEARTNDVIRMVRKKNRFFDEYMYFSDNGLFKERTALLDAYLTSKDRKDPSRKLEAIKVYDSLTKGLESKVIESNLKKGFIELIFKDFNLKDLLKVDRKIYRDNGDYLVFLRGIVDELDSDTKKNTLLEVIEKIESDLHTLKTETTSDSELESLRIDFVINKFSTLSDKAMIDIIVGDHEYKGIKNKAEFFDEINTLRNEGKKREDAIYEVSMRIIEEYFNPETGKASLHDKTEVARRITEYADSSDFSKVVSFKELINYVLFYILLVAIFIGICVLGSYLVNQYVFKGTLFYISLTASLINLLVISILYFLNLRQRAYRHPFIRTLWEGLVITAILFAALAGAAFLIMQ